MVHLTAEELERVEYVRPALQAILSKMAAAGVVEPIATLHAAVEARDAYELPLLAIAQGVPVEAVPWAIDVAHVLAVHDHSDGVRLRDVLHRCLDQITLRVGVSAPRG